jgi:hypothetical protein
VSGAGLGSVDLSSDDLDIAQSADLATSYRIGLRFPNLGIPQMAEIVSARVQFTAQESKAGATDFRIRGEAADDAAPFTTAAMNLTGRDETSAEVAWAGLPDWVAGSAHETPDLASVVQEIVDRVGWTNGSAVVLFLEGTGHRDALAFDADPTRAPVLLVEYRDPAEVVAHQFDVCVPEVLNGNLNPSCWDEEDGGIPGGGPDHPDCTFVGDRKGGVDPREDFVADCTGRVQETFRGLVGADGCGYVPDPTTCTCDVIAQPIAMEGDPPDYGKRVKSCGTSVQDPFVCMEQPVTLEPAEAKCQDFDPERFEACVVCQDPDAPDPPDVDCNAFGGVDCATFVSATNAPGDMPVCVAQADTDSATPRALTSQAFAKLSLAEVAGTSEILVGDREPEQDPATAGLVQLWGTPCPGGSCPIGLAYNFALDDITFSVKFASDPTFGDLGGFGSSDAGAALLGATGVGVFGMETTLNSAEGTRGSQGLALASRNDQPLTVTVDWTGKAFSLVGNAASTADGEERLCSHDGLTACATDAECDALQAGSTCDEVGFEPVTIDVNLSGTLVNQPPAAVAGADQVVECTSAAGAEFRLDGSGSSDPDANIALVSWRAGSRVGPEVGFDPVVTQSLGVGEGSGYVLRLIDRFGAADEDATAVQVVDTTPPVVMCLETTNPHGKNVPGGQNSDGYYVLLASDVCDLGPQIFISDAGGAGPFGPFVSGDQVKITEAPGAVPGSMPIGSGKGGAGAVVAHVTLRSDAQVTALDDSGNAASVSCPVAPPLQ